MIAEPEIGTRWAEEYLRVPWSDHDQGQDGTHCWGIVRLIYNRELGIQLRKYGIHPDDQMKVAGMIHSARERWLKIPISEAQAFDVAIFKMPGGRLSHTGIFLNGETILQTLKKTGPHTIDINSRQGKRLVDVRRYRG